MYEMYSSYSYFIYQFLFMCLFICFIIGVMLSLFMNLCPNHTTVIVHFIIDSDNNNEVAWIQAWGVN